MPPGRDYEIRPVGPGAGSSRQRATRRCRRLRARPRAGLQGRGTTTLTIHLDRSRWTGTVDISTMSPSGHRAKRGLPSATTTTAPVHPPRSPPRAFRPGLRRRTAVAAAAPSRAPLPVTFEVTITGMLVNGTPGGPPLPPVTGQGLVLVALWLGASSRSYAPGGAASGSLHRGRYRHLASWPSASRIRPSPGRRRPRPRP